MRLSEYTIKVLKNFQLINQSIIIEKGNVLKTMNASETIFASAEVEDSFPMSFAIYDLGKFLNLINLSDESDILFKPNHLIIKQNNSRIRVGYCNKELLKQPFEVELPEVDVSFVLDTETHNKLVKALSILSADGISFEGKGGKIFVNTFSEKNRDGDLFSTEIGSTDKDFFLVLESEKLKMMQKDYQVNISFAGLCEFKGEDITYHIAASS